MTEPTLINSNLNDYSEEVYYYPFWLNETDALKVVTPWMTYLTKYVLQVK